MTFSISNLLRRVAPVVALGALVISMDGTWATAQPVTSPAARAAPATGGAQTTGVARPGASTTGAGAPAAGAFTAGSTASAGPPGAADTSAGERGGARPGRKLVTGKLNLNTATEEQLMMLPSVGPSKAERIAVWRKKNGGFKRVADLRKVKGFGYKTLKKLEPFLDIKGDTTLAPR